MASSTETCQYCSHQSEELWNCHECQLLLCERCNQNIHTKIASALNHRVSKLQTGSDEAGILHRQLIFSTHCTQHVENTCFGICGKCTKCLCPECIEKPDDKFVASRKDRLKEIQEKITENMPIVSAQMETLNKFKEMYTAKYDHMKETICNKKEEMKASITEHAKSLIGELDEWWSPTKGSIAMEEQRLTSVENNLKECSSIIQQAIESDDPSRIIQVSEMIDSKIHEKIAALGITQPKPILFSIKMSAKNLTLGSFLKVPQLKIVQELDCAVTSTLHTVDDDLILGYGNWSYKMKYFILAKDKCYYTKNVSLLTETFTTNATKQIMHITSSKDISMRNENGEDKKLFSVPYFYGGSLTAIHHDKKDRILLGYTSRSQEGSRGIMVYNREYQLLFKVEKDKDKQWIFTHPVAVTTNYNGDICVIDQLTQEESKLVVLDKMGELRWEYDGRIEGQAELFYPKRVATSAKGFIFISETKRNIVIMFSQDGDLLTGLDESDGIGEPSGLTVNGKGQLLVGCKGKLHIVEIQE